MYKKQITTAKKLDIVLVLVTSGEEITMTNMNSSLHGVSCLSENLVNIYSAVQ